MRRSRVIFVKLCQSTLYSTNGGNGGRRFESHGTVEIIFSFNSFGTKVRITNLLKTLIWHRFICCNSANGRMAIEKRLAYYGLEWNVVYCNKIVFLFLFSDSNIWRGHPGLHVGRQLLVHRDWGDGLDDAPALHRSVDADKRHSHQRKNGDARLRRQKRRKSGGMISFLIKINLCHI